MVSKKMEKLCLRSKMSRNSPSPMTPMSSAKSPMRAMRASHFVPEKLMASASTSNVRARTRVVLRLSSSPKRLARNPAPNSATEVIVTMSAQM